MNYRIDLHCHSRFSADGVSEPEEMVQVAWKWPDWLQGRMFRPPVPMSKSKRWKKGRDS